MRRSRRGPVPFPRTAGYADAPPRPDVPLRRSLLLRMLAVTALVSVCSVAATAWVVVRTTAVAIQKEQGQALADDAKIYNGLLGYAATHPSWDGVATTVRSLARETGHRVVLLTRGDATVADSDPVPGHPYRPPSKPTAVVDPLSVSHEGLQTEGTERIDPRAVGPFRLLPAERERLRRAAARSATCLGRELGIRVQVTDAPNGRPKLVMPSADLAGGLRCEMSSVDAPTPTESRALGALNKLVDTCLDRTGVGPVQLNMDFTWQPPGSAPVRPSEAPPTPAPSTAARSGTAPAPTDRPSAAPSQADSRTADTSSLNASSVNTCVLNSRAEQLAPYVASPVTLYVSSPARAATTFFDLSAGNRARIAGGAALVLLVTVTVTTLAGIRLVRPLRALTHAAERMEDGDVSARVRVTGTDELGRLALAFNSMSERREQLEAVRKAMVSDVAHELRTPLSNIRGWLEAAEDGVVPHDQVLLTSLLEEALLLQHVIDDLRDLSAADAGELRLRREPVEVADLLAQTATAHGAGAEGAGVRIVVPAAGDLRLDADPVRLRQAVGNLVSNAIRHTPRGGVVTLRSREDGSHVLIEVADTGSGIDPGELPHVFDRFWRAEKSRSRQTGGSGLGLSIVRKLAEAHGGTVTATSTPGVGSVFTLSLPRRG